MDSGFKSQENRNFLNDEYFLRKVMELNLSFYKSKRPFKRIIIDKEKVRAIAYFIENP